MSQPKLTLLLGPSSEIGANTSSGSLPPTLRDAGASPVTRDARVPGNIGFPKPWLGGLLPVY